MPSSQTAPVQSTRRVLVIDDDEVMLEFIRACLEDGLAGVAVTTYDSKRLGRPTADFDWASHDVLLLDYNLGGGQIATDWLQRFASVPGFPSTILLTAETSPKVVGNAVRRGAGGYLNKAHLNPDVLVQTVSGILDTVTAEAEAKSGTEAGMASGLDDGAMDGEPAAEFQGQNALDTGPGGANYRFIRLIGRGAMSRVYLAERSEDRMTLVLKILSRDVARDPENVQRFAREGEMIARIDSPYVVKVYDHGTTNSYGYIAMEFFGRGDLAQRMSQGVNAEDAVVYLHNIACGLEAIHREGIVHRDLKPGNIMFRGDGSMALADFGLSKQVDMDMSLTQTGVIMGTPYCMSPEQTQGLEADHRSDLYAAGVMFWEMLTGERPFTAPNVPALLLAIQRDPVPQLSAELARYQPVVERLLAKDPDARFQTANELITELQGLVATH